MINSRSLEDLRDDVRENCVIFLNTCKANGLNVLVTQTLRDDEYQATLYEQGRSKPGNIVTNSKTTTFHGRGLAFDICKNVKGHEYDDNAFFTACAEIGKMVGFTWGGDWKSFTDKPHFQWDGNGKYKYTSVPTMPKYEKKPDYYEMLKQRANLADSTIGFLKTYRWADDLVRKLATMK